MYDFFKNLLKPFLWPNTQLFFFFSSPYFAALGAYISDYIRWPVPDGLCLTIQVDLFNAGEWQLNDSHEESGEDDDESGEEFLSNDDGDRAWEYE